MKNNSHISAPFSVRDPETARYERNRHYAGEIYLSDFYSCQPDGNIAKRVLQAAKFDEACLINDLLRQKRRDYL